MKNKPLFETARLKLTAWYLLIIMVVSGLFSAAFYRSSTRELQLLIRRARLQQQQEIPVGVPRGVERRLTADFYLEDLEKIRQNSLLTLVIANGVILILSGVGGYFLAGRTLQPIAEMVEKQNDFISNSSHELRTPIATLRAEMEANLLEKKLSVKKARQLITSNLEEVISLQKLAENLMDLARVDGANNIKYEAVDISGIVDAAEKKVALLAKRKRIKLTTKSDTALVQADKATLTEAVVIILENAIKYSPNKSEVIVTSQPKGKKVKIDVSDQGVGIATNELPRIFDRFYRADKSRSQVAGYGLGLAIARGIIEAHQGEIEVESWLGQGSIFTISLPRVSRQLRAKNI